MAVITWDLVEGDSAELSREGYTATRIVNVSELSAAYGYDRINEAISAIAIPLGTIHPSYTSSALQTYSATSIASDTVTLALSYLPVIDVPYDIQVNSSANSAQTNKDKDGTTIEVSYTYPSDYQGDPNKVSKTETVGKTVDTRVPTSTITISKREITTGNDLTTLSQNYVSTVNQAGWNIRPSDPARSWMCSSITGDYFGLYINGSVFHIYDTQYIFEYQYAGWDSEVVFLDPTTGEPPEPSTWTAGITHKEIELMQQTNFTNLTSDIS